jgi:hypothetical protein
MSGTNHMGSQQRKPIESTPNDSPRYTEVQGREHTDQLKKQCRKTWNLPTIEKLGWLRVLSQSAEPRSSGMTTLTEMRKLSNTKVTIRVVTNQEYPIKPFCTNPFKFDEYALRPRHQNLYLSTLPKHFAN